MAENIQQAIYGNIQYGISCSSKELVYFQNFDQTLSTFYV